MLKPYTLTPATLRIVRNIKQLSQQELADLISVDRSHLARIENESRTFTPEIRHRLELAIGWEDPALQDVITSILTWKELSTNE